MNMIKTLDTECFSNKLYYYFFFSYYYDLLFYTSKEKTKIYVAPPGVTTFRIPIPSNLDILPWEEQEISEPQFLHKEIKLERIILTDGEILRVGYDKELDVLVHSKGYTKN